MDKVIVDATQITTEHADVVNDLANKQQEFVARLQALDCQTLAELNNRIEALEARREQLISEPEPSGDNVESLAAELSKLKETQRELTDLDQHIQIFSERDTDGRDEQAGSQELDLQQAYDDKLQELEVDSIEELEQEINEQRARLDKLTKKPKKLAEAKANLESLEEGLTQLKACSNEIAQRQAQSHDSDMQQKLTELQKIYNEHLAVLEVDSYEELVQEIQEQEDELQALPENKRKKRQTIEARLEELREVLPKIEHLKSQMQALHTSVEGQPESQPSIDLEAGDIASIHSHAAASTEQTQDESKVLFDDLGLAQSAATNTSSRAVLSVPDEIEIAPDMNDYRDLLSESWTVVDPVISEQTNQMVRFTLTSLAQTLTLPVSSERAIQCLIGWLNLRLKNVARVQFEGQSPIIVDDKLIENAFLELYKLLQREGQSRQHVIHELEKLESKIKQKDWRRVHKDLQTLSKSYFRQLNISALVNMCQQMPATDEIAGKDLIVLLGKSGAGKSTTVHFFLGNELEQTTTGRLVPKSSNPILDRIRVGEGRISETRHMGIVPLERGQAASSVFLCDTPGFGDTGQADGVSILNSLVISRALRCCKSIRVLGMAQIRYTHVQIMAE